MGTGAPPVCGPHAGCLWCRRVEGDSTPTPTRVSLRDQPLKRRELCEGGAVKKGEGIKEKTSDSEDTVVNARGKGVGT